jgi:hypothetical protein
MRIFSRSSLQEEGILCRRKAYAGKGMRLIPSHTPADAVGRGLENSTKPFCPPPPQHPSHSYYALSFILCFE